jgi:hypothetical protein
VNELPREWPTRQLRASGELEWNLADAGDITRRITGRFDLDAEGADDAHRASARATVADGQIVLDDVKGMGPEPDQVFRGSGRIALLARTYDLSLDYERTSLAATAVPTPARAGFSRAWSVLRGSVARSGWADEPQVRRVQWHGGWDND